MVPDQGNSRIGINEKIHGIILKKDVTWEVLA